MNISDLLLRRDLPVNVFIVILTLIFSLSLHSGHKRQYTRLKNDIIVQRKKNKLLSEIKSIIMETEALDKDFWQGGSAAANVIADQLNKKLQEANANNAIVSVARQEDKDSYVAITLKLTFQLSYKSILNFLKYIDTNPKILKIESASIKKISEDMDEEDGKLNVDISLRAYFLKG